MNTLSWLLISPRSPALTLGSIARFFVASHGGPNHLKRLAEPK